jgi:hypothetical protein
MREEGGKGTLLLFHYYLFVIGLCTSSFFPLSCWMVVYSFLSFLLCMFFMVDKVC